MQSLGVHDAFAFAVVLRARCGCFVRVLRRTWFNIGVLLFTTSWTLILYMAVWVPRVRGIDLEPAVYSPRLVPATAVVSVLCCIALILGLWPVYGLFTPGILFVLWLGCLMIAHFLPSM